MQIYTVKIYKQANIPYLWCVGGGFYMATAVIFVENKIMDITLDNWRKMLLNLITLFYVVLRKTEK